MTKKLFKEVTQLQSCMACLETNAAIVETECCEFRVCNACKELQSVCRECEVVGQVSHLPCLRACTKCLERNIKCTKCLVLTRSVDCESGNPKMADICGSEENPNLTYLMWYPMLFTLARHTNVLGGTGFLFSVRVTDTARKPLFSGNFTKWLMTGKCHVHGSFS